MNRTPTHPPFKTWEFFSACIHYLGMQSLTKLYRGNGNKDRGEGSRIRQIQRWAANPATTASNQTNPLDRYEYLLNKLMAKGQVDEAIAAVSRQASIVGCLLMHADSPEPDKPTIEQECLDDYQYTVDYHTLLQDPTTDEQELLAAKRLLIREIEEDYTLWKKNKGHQ